MPDNQYDVLFHRHPENPIRLAAHWPSAINTVFNPGATRLHDGTALRPCRAEDRRDVSHLCAARPANGVDGWTSAAASPLNQDQSGDR